jgi:hypothetical protein
LQTFPRTVDFFYKNKKSADGLSLECKGCVKARTKKWIEQNKTKKAESDKIYAIKNSKKLKEYRKLYRDRHKTKSREYAAKYREENKDKLKEQKKLYHSQDYVKRKRSERNLQRKNSDIKYRFMCTVRSNVSDALKNGYGALRHLPYTVDELMRHLERQFTNKMTWKNYGSYWHVDHIVPSKSFNFENPDDPDFLACWSLTNVRPLEAKTNMWKNAKRIFLS